MKLIPVEEYQPQDSQNQKLIPLEEYKPKLIPLEEYKEEPKDPSFFGDIPEAELKQDPEFIRAAKSIYKWNTGDYKSIKISR